MSSEQPARKSLRLLPAEAKEPGSLALAASPNPPTRPRRTLFPGDTIRYCSPAFVVGSAEGLRQAVVVAIDPDNEHPVRINGFELLTQWTYLTVIIDSHGAEVIDKWSMLKFWTLTKGRFSVRTQQSRLNEALRDAISESFAVVRRTVAQGHLPWAASLATDEAESHEDTGQEDISLFDADLSPDRVRAVVVGGRVESSSEPAKESGASVGPESIDEAELAPFEELMTLAQRRAKHHRGRDRHGARSVSRKSRHKKLRKTTRDSQNVYHARLPEPVHLQRFMRLPAVKEALVRMREERAQARRALLAAIAAGSQHAGDTRSQPSVQSVTPADQEQTLSGQVPSDDGTAAAGAANEEAQLIVIESDEECAADPVSETPGEQLREAVDWPADVVRIKAQMNPNDIQFKALDDYGLCACHDVGDCYRDRCENSQMRVYCTKENCTFGGECGNSPRELDSLRLFRSASMGLGVFTTRPINAGVVVAEYCGVLEAIEGTTDDVPIKHNSGYSLIHPVKARDGKFVYIEPFTHGSISRFLNHSCAANCMFAPAQFADKATILVVSTRFIRANEELTVTYSGELWFECQCGSVGCISSMSVATA
jgi:hypothetical protein